MFYKNYENLSRSKYLVIILQQVLQFFGSRSHFESLSWYLPGLAEEKEIADENNFDWDNTTAEQNENECLKYIEHSLHLLQQAGEGVLSNVLKPSASSTSKIETSSAAT